MQSQEQAIIVNNLSRQFGDFKAVDDISFEVRRGEIFGFLGPNGAGKSTTIRMLNGLLLPTSGQGRVGGTTSSGKTPRSKTTSVTCPSGFPSMRT